MLARHGVGLGVVEEHLAALELLDGDVALRGEARAGLRGVMPSRNCSAARHRRARPGRCARTATISFLATTFCVFSQSCAAVKGRWNFSKCCCTARAATTTARSPRTFWGFALGLGALAAAGLLAPAANAAGLRAPAASPAASFLGFFAAGGSMAAVCAPQSRQ